VADLVCLDAAIAARHNALQRLRDPSHTAALTEDALVAAVGATPARGRERRPLRAAPGARGVGRAGTRGSSRAHTPAGAADELREAFAAELDGGPAPGLRAERDADGRVALRQRWVRVVATPI
jgi:hypothetical protein